MGVLAAMGIAPGLIFGFLAGVWADRMLGWVNANRRSNIRLRSKGSLRSSIDMVTGIGPKRKRMLLRRFGSVQAIRFLWQATAGPLPAVQDQVGGRRGRLRQHAGNAATAFQEAGHRSG